MTAAQETELKLQLTEDAAESLRVSGLLTGRPKTAMQRSVYFDTPGHDLAAASLSLRIRRTGSKRIQTIKQADQAAVGVFSRPEWEIPVRGDTPVPDDRTPLADVLGEQAAQLAPVFAVAVTRRTWEVSHDGARIEVVIDQGEISAADRRCPICECELELVSGSPQALFALARRISAAAPLSLGVLSKSERGYRLIGPLPQAAKAEAIPLTGDLTAAEAFGRIVLSCQRQFRLNEDLLLATRSPESLHQARVALRRLRSALAIFQPMLGDHGAALREELRWLAGELGDARDLDVLLVRSPDGALRDRLRTARAKAYDRMTTALLSGRTRGLMLDLAEWIAMGDWQSDPATADARGMSAHNFAAKALSRFRRKVKAGGRNLAALNDEARHDLRKDAKKLRYAADFFEPLFQDDHRKAHKRFGAALSDFQDRMGALNDLAAAPLVLERLGLIDMPQADRLTATADRDALMRAAQDAHDRLARARKYWA
ncbi:inorganic triphosphatase [Paracoccus subflavus]|uniref:Inorganic triphosphatase n=1 Tax=Paracoccus subflavus TaxID=2528244 RepID=A0A4Q9G727_9RHOB|nr:CHAD domain-containing protein [Paracoccus subflavus]TBN42636.1 inorganic triphosphatase [Paracoccus subflavus]